MFPLWNFLGECGMFLIIIGTWHSKRKCLNVFESLMHVHFYYYYIIIIVVVLKIQKSTTEELK